MFTALLIAAALTAEPITVADRFPLAPIIKMVLPGRYRELPPLRMDDPIAPLAEGDAAALTKIPDAKFITAFIAAYVDRVEAFHGGDASPELMTWLQAHPLIRRDFWLAINPHYDDVAAACAILDSLRQKFPKQIEPLSHLAIAMAVVHDNPAAVTSSRFAAIWGVTPEQFCEAPGPEELFAHFSDPKVLALMPFKPNQLSWSMLVHVVDLDADAEQRAWALANEASQKDNPASLYPAVPYDTQKLETKRSKLGDRPYTLVNLLRIGGVCGDQGHFASRVAKIFGIPAMKCTGEGRYGAGSLHAWCGFLAAQKGRPILEFTGRFQGDFYYTGDILDPQTSTEILDRAVALAYDGASLSFAKLQEAECLARAAKACFDEQPLASQRLAEAAIGRNTYCADAWRVLMHHVAAGHLDRKAAAPWGTQMLKDLKAHPDLTIECIGLFLTSIPTSEVEARQKFWNAAYALYALRPDLQIALRMAQCSDLVEARRQLEAISRALETLTSNGKEGSLILPLTEFVVTTARALKEADPKFKVAAVRNALAQVDVDFPKRRGDEPSPAYADFKKLVDSL